MKYARYYAMDVRWVATGPQMVVGSPQFVTGYLLGSIVMLVVLDAKRDACPHRNGVLAD